MTLREPDTNYSEPGPAPAQQSIGLRIPRARPIVTYILLGVIVVIFAVDFLLAQTSGRRSLFEFGAQSNPYVAVGEYWRLLTSVFLHAGLTHLLFNAYALFVLGRDVEAFYGHWWFLVIYLVAGLGGSVAWYVLGDPVPSVGASGAIFGLIGAEAAFYVRNRRLFGQFGRQRLGNLAVLLAINLVFGFTIPNINNIAHLGGLVAGFALGYFLAPSLRVGYAEGELGAVRQLIDQRSTGMRILVIWAAIILLGALVVLGNQRWDWVTPDMLGF
ncbi:MAG: rhomboid family intramembrane serine protease [Anaerolineae bacterium]|jgi:rhomboid protease GluP|nr:rhomboid family intramembrane serine protease [Anaerolineae bacterium]